MFLLNMDWSLWWPLMLITPGASILLAIGKGSEHPIGAAWLGYLRSVASTMIGLGFVFLADSLTPFNLEMFGSFHWWSLFIAIPAVAALAQAGRLFGRLQTIDINVVQLTILGLVGGGTAVMELFGLSWEMWNGSWERIPAIAPVGFIIIGLIILINGLRRSPEPVK
jgi:hypothetical protein